MSEQIAVVSLWNYTLFANIHTPSADRSGVTLMQHIYM